MSAPKRKAKGAAPAKRTAKGAASTKPKGPTSAPKRAAKPAKPKPAKPAKREPKRVPLPKDQKRALDAARWAAHGDHSPAGLYPDAEHPGRFHRKGRGDKSARTVRRITVYVDEEIATALDVYRARDGGRLSRSDVLQEALRAHLELLGEPVNR